MNLGARLAYNWDVGSSITLIPEVRAFWKHEFLNNPRNTSSAWMVEVALRSTM